MVEMVNGERLLRLLGVGRYGFGEAKIQPAPGVGYRVVVPVYANERAAGERERENQNGFHLL
jgi:hypothetical protein